MHNQRNGLNTNKKKNFIPQSATGEPQLNSNLRSSSRIRRKQFLFGAATSAHQIEGNNIHNDWWNFEKDYTGGVSSGKACNSYELFREDRKLLQEIGLNAYRFSIEWSRIEPNEGQFDEAAMQHYVELVDDLIANGIEPVLTLHHFTNPLWFELLGGWQLNRTVSYFSRFVEYVLMNLAGKVRYYVTINEPNIYIYSKYLVGAWHPGEHNFWKAAKAVGITLRTHKAVYKIIKQYRPDAMVGIAIHHAIFHPSEKHFKPVNWLLTKLIENLLNFYAYNMLWRKYLDFLGLNFYTRVNVDVSLFDALRLRINPEIYHDQTMHFIQHPEDIYLALQELKKYDLPIMITESGMLAANDELRVDYIKKTIYYLQLARADGINLIGYMHWSLLDNFEWGYGFEPKFGLYSVDPDTFVRKAKPSAKIYKDLVAKWMAESNL